MHFFDEEIIGKKVKTKAKLFVKPFGSYDLHSVQNPNNLIKVDAGSVGNVVDIDVQLEMRLKLIVVEFPGLGTCLLGSTAWEPV